MKSLKEKFEKKKFTKKPTSKYRHRKQEEVFVFLKRYKVDPTTMWGKRLAGRMLRDFQIFQSRKNIVEENLAWLFENNQEIYHDIMKDNDSRTRYVWAKLFKRN